MTAGGMGTRVVFVASTGSNEESVMIAKTKDWGMVKEKVTLRCGIYLRGQKKWNFEMKKYVANLMQMMMIDRRWVYAVECEKPSAASGLGA